MFDIPAALGYLRSDLSGARQSWDEIQIRSLAQRFGYDLRKTVVFTAATDRPIHRLRVLVDRLGIEAIVVPSAEHFADNEIPAELIAVTDIITVSPEQTVARWAAIPPTIFWNRR